MSNDFGIKVMNVGKDITSTDIRDQAMNSQYSMFKYHSEQLGTVTISAGQTDAYGTISHGLGYVPAFMSYVSYPGDSLERIVPSIPYGVSPDWHATAYAGTSNIVYGFHLKDPYNQTKLYGDNTYNGWSGVAGSWRLGQRDGSDASSAIRFVGVNFSGDETITSVTLEPYVDYIGDSGDVKFITYGIDEDNTGDFDTNPMGRTRTTASVTQTQNVSSVPFTFGINAKSIFEEIISRENWSSGNAMGFLNVNNGTDNQKWMFHAGPSDFVLTVTESGSINIVFRVIIFKDKII